MEIAGCRGLLVVGPEPAAGACLNRESLPGIGRVDRCPEVALALSIARSHRPDLIVVGPEVGPRHTLDLLGKMRGDDDLKGVYVIVISDADRALRAEVALDAGANDFLSEPVDREELLARLRAGARCRAMQRELMASRHRDAILEMAATLGHEINNPLTALFGHLELALRYLEQGSAERMKHHLHVAGEVASRIGNVAQRLGAMAEPRVTNYLGDQDMLDLEAVEPLAVAD